MGSLRARSPIQSLVCIDGMVDPIHLQKHPVPVSFSIRLFHRLRPAFCSSLWSAAGRVAG